MRPDRKVSRVNKASRAHADRAATMVMTTTKRPDRRDHAELPDLKDRLVHAVQRERPDTGERPARQEQSDRVALPERWDQWEPPAHVVQPAPPDPWARRVTQVHEVPLGFGVKPGRRVRQVRRAFVERQEFEERQVPPASRATPARAEQLVQTG